LNRTPLPVVKELDAGLAPGASMNRDALIPDLDFTEAAYIDDAPSGLQ
jgi:hypothetical protein